MEDSTYYNQNKIANINLLKKKGIEYRTISSELIDEFNSLYQNEEFDVLIFNDGKMTDLYKSSEDNLQGISYILVSIIEEQNSMHNDIKIMSMESIMKDFSSEVRNFVVINIISIYLLIFLYYCQRLIFCHKKISTNFFDVFMYVLLSTFIIVSSLRFFSNSFDIINIEKFYTSIFSVDIISKDGISAIIEVGKFMYLFLSDYIYEYATCTILGITLGEFILGKAEYRDKETQAACYFLEMIS
ncbi:hypothetical protein QBE53_06360 [Vallitaleaceae bacterium 9-2]